MPLFAITRHNQKPEAASIATKSDTKDLKNSLQSSRRTGTSRRLLSQPCRLVGSERSRCRTRQLRVFVECLYKPSELITSENTFLSRMLQHVNSL